MEKQYIDQYGNLVKGKIELDGMLILNPTPEQLKAADALRLKK